MHYFYLGTSSSAATLAAGTAAATVIGVAGFAFAAADVADHGSIAAFAATLQCVSVDGGDVDVLPLLVVILAL